MTELRDRLQAALGALTLERELGGGGMSRVFVARDEALGRDVVVKVLSPELAAEVSVERFTREIRTAAGLQHPQIVTVLSAGTVDGLPFYMMPYISGESLRARLAGGPLGFREAIEILRDLAKALAFAHGRGIAHRDIKPENVLLTGDSAVVTDFGIAKAIAASQASGAHATTLTQAGMTLGTPAYMAPEQATADPAIDHRADIYSFGCVAYEVVTGAAPFTGLNHAALIAAHLTQQPPAVASLRPDVPPSLARLIAECLAKDPDMRVQSAADCLALLDLAAAELSGGSRVVTPQGAPQDAPEKSLAVLPFVNRSADTDNQFFSDGLSEDLINALTAQPGLHVAARTSAFRFAGSDLDIRAIGEKLNVAFVLEGSVRRAGTRLRVTAQLVSVATGFQLWTERYDREMADVFAVQDEIVAAIVSALMPALLGTVKAPARRATENLEAYELYLKGRHYWHQRSPSTVSMAIQHFEQAIALDPEYALAYCGLADCLGVLSVYAWAPPDALQPRAKAAVDRARSIAPDMAEVNFSSALYTFFLERRWRDARPYFSKAIELNPKAPVHHTYFALFAAIEGEPDEAERLLERGLELDPLSPFLHGLSSVVYHAMGRYEAAEAVARRALDLQRDHLVGVWTLGVALSALGRHAEAIAELERAVVISRAPVYVSLLGLALARGGRANEARALLAELEERAERGEFVPPVTRLGIHLGLGNIDDIRRELTVTLDQGVPPMMLRGTFGVFLGPYRSDPAVARFYAAWFAGDRMGTGP